MRRWIKAYLGGGFDALADRPHVGKQSALTAEMLRTVRDEIAGGGRTWNAGQIGQWLQQRHGDGLSADRLRVHLKRAGLVYKRTSRSLMHKQSADQVVAKQAALTTLKRGAQPPCYSWFPVGGRFCVPYEAPQGRRVGCSCSVNAVGAYFSHGPLTGRFVFETWASLPKNRSWKQRKTPTEVAAAHGLRLAEVGAIDAERLLDFVWQTAGRSDAEEAAWKRERPLVIVLDNYSVHKGRVIQSALPLLEAADVFLFYLPPYCPELSRIEPVWNDVKHYGMQTRSYAQVSILKGAVENALTQKAQQLWRTRPKTTNLQQRAA